jgi:hypothetical protein
MHNIKIYPNKIGNKICDSLIDLYDEGIFSEDSKENKLDALIYSSKTTHDDRWAEILEDIKELLKDNIEDYLKFNRLLDPDSYAFSHAGISMLSNQKGVPYHYDLEISLSSERVRINHFAVLIYLNDSYEGGELIFPIQKVNYKPTKGSVLIFPTSHLYPHAVTPVISGKRYMVRVSYVLKKSF